MSAFGVAKAGIARLSESLDCELADTDVKVFCMHPGFVPTPMTERLAWTSAARRYVAGDLAPVVAHLLTGGAEPR